MVPPSCLGPSITGSHSGFEITVSFPALACSSILFINPISLSAFSFLATRSSSQPASRSVMVPLCSFFSSSLIKPSPMSAAAFFASSNVMSGLIGLVSPSRVLWCSVAAIFPTRVWAFSYSSTLSSILGGALGGATVSRPISAAVFKSLTSPDGPPSSSE